jgi:signal transduction histidine kinase
VLSQPQRLTLAQMTGAYQNELQALVFRLTPADQAAYHRLVTGSAWQLATAGEADLARSGKLAAPATPATWLAAENTVSAAVLGLWADSLRQTENDAVAGANATLTRSVLLGGLAMLLAVAAFAAAIVLANGLVRRLRRLRTKTLELADVTLPSLVTRIGNGELVNVESEMTPLEYGSDELGQVAEAFSTAQRTAVAAAAAEASTRSGINKVFLDIAHRSQMVVYRQLELLDVAEARQGDPEHLDLLFQLDHLATRARRNAENLLILGGGQPGRKWRQAAGLEDIVRSAVSETEQFARVSTVRLPEVHVLGAAVGDLIHLLAELVDNATSFSPPESAVWVRGNVVGKGVVVEVEDQGLGIEFAERERLSAALRDPPDFQSMAVAGQRHLGLFVVGQLAQRHGITVSLLESAYGGIKAIVLIPSGSVASAAAGDWPELSPAGRYQQQLPPGVSSEPAAGAVPPARPASGSYPVAAKPPQWTAGNRAQESARRSRAPLPRRERLANLAPGLRPGTEVAGGHAPQRQSRSAEEARGSMSAFQRGTRLGRESSGQDNR